MTRSTTFIAALTIACTLFGCANAPDADAVDVITAELGEEHFELVEMSDDDGFIDVEVYYSAGQAEEIQTGIFRWPATDPTPIELTEMLANIPERVINHATPVDGPADGPADGSVDGPVDGPAVSHTVVWPRLLVEARVFRLWNLGLDCDQTDGHSDCLQTR